MRKFLGFILKGIIITIVVAAVLDYGYTLVYNQSNNRGKIDYVYNSNGKQYDVIILGSSRANNHFVSEMFEKKGLKTFNFGMSGGHLFEADLLLKLMLERKYKIKNLILEADLNLSNEHRAEGVSSKFLPYLHTSEAVKNHFLKEEDFNELYYIPFYRYIKFDSQIGFREVFKIIKEEKTSLLNNKGYYPLLKSKKGNMKNNLTNLKPLVRNKYYESIKQLCIQNNINFIPVMTPMCENTQGINYFDKVKKAYPEIHNYENAVVEDHYFSSCGHMNDNGARLFTARVINDFF
ncbi:hypothetical protein [Flavobacterium faecale]|uniref:hypothetical protein n=1 Tax=Flavobacterium faecale TaxID=1355330 RepID=UPI003AAFFCA5